MVFDNFPAAHCGKLSRDNDPPWQIWCNQTCFCRYFSLCILHPNKDIFKARKWDAVQLGGNLCVQEKSLKRWYSVGMSLWNYWRALESSSTPKMSDCVLGLNCVLFQIKFTLTFFWWPAIKDRHSCQLELECLKLSKPGRERHKQRQMEWEAPVIHSMSKSLVTVRREKKGENLNPTPRTVALLFSWSLFQPHVVCMLMRRGVNVWTTAPYISICNTKGSATEMILNRFHCKANNCRRKATMFA